MDARSDTRKRTLTTLIAAIFAALLCVTLAGPAGAADDDDGGEFVSRQVVVKLASTAVISEINKKYGTTTIETLLGSSRIYLLRTPQNANPETLAERMESDTNRLRRVIYAEPNFRTELPEASRQHRARPGGEPTLSSDPAQYRSQYAVDNLNLTEAHGVNRGAGSVVAVIDTGVQAGHPMLSGRLMAGYDFVGRDDNPADSGEGKLAGHGTHVAGIVALGAPDAKIMPIRALDPDGHGTTFQIAKAIRYAIRKDADVVNLSLGTSRETELLEDLIGDDDDDDGGSNGRDVIFVAAAGNDSDSKEQFPAAEEDAIAVTSVGQGKTRSGFANYGDWISISAPGSGIHSPFPENRYAMWDGTSMATPFVAAQAALIRGERPAASSECVIGIIQQTAQPLADNLGAGHADAGASTRYAANPANPCAGAGDDD